MDSEPTGARPPRADAAGTAPSKPQPDVCTVRCILPAG